MKKLLSLTLALAMTLTLLAGCGGTAAPTQAPATQAPATQAPATQAPVADPVPAAETKETQAPEMADTANHPNCLGNVTEYAWADAFYAQDPSAFELMFDENISQAAGTTPGVTFGAKTVSAIFGWASQFYEYCNFIHQAKQGNRTFLEWELLTHNGMFMTGMTILTKDESGKVVGAVNAHRNLMEIVIFLEHFFQGPEDIGSVYTVHEAALAQYGIEAKYVRKPDGTIRGRGVDDGYIDAFETARVSDFKAILADDVVFSGGYVTENMTGADDVAATLAAMAGYYEHCVFTVQANEDNRTYIQYEGRLLNQMMVPDGFIVIVRDDNGKITEVMDNPMPITVNTVLSTYLREATDGEVSARYFYRDSLFVEAVEKYGLEGVYGESTNMYIGG